MNTPNQRLPQDGEAGAKRLMRVRSLIITTIGAHSSVAFRDTFPIIGKAFDASANTPINQNLKSLAHPSYVRP